MKPSMKRIDLIDEFSRDDWEHAVLLTYTHDLMFFEREILRRLRDKGCRNICLLVDDTAHRETFNDYRNIKFVGKEYVVQTIRVGLVFHPKIYILLRSDRCKIILGSGNLTVPGFYTNKEIFSSREYLLSNDVDLRVVQSVQELIEELGSTNKFRSETLNSLFQAFEKLPKKSLSWQEEDLKQGIFIQNFEQTLFKQMKKLFKYNIEQLTIISPYFDMDHRIFKQLMKIFKPQKIILVLQNNHNNFNLVNFKNIADKLGIEYELMQLQFKGDIMFRNHAKLLVFSTTDHDDIVWGSANFTTAALNRTARNGNLETVMLQRTEKNWWKTQFYDDKVFVNLLNEAEFRSIISEGYDHISYSHLRLLDGVLTGIGLELMLAGEMPIDELTLTINLQNDYKITGFHTEYINSLTKLVIPIEKCPLMPTESVIFLSLTVISKEEKNTSNCIWVNRPIDLDRARTDEVILLKREMFKNPDFSSREQILSILDYIYRELKLESKDLPKQIPRLTPPKEKEEMENEKPEFFPGEEPEDYENWTINPLAQIDYDLYNRYVQAIFEELGLISPANMKPGKVSKEPSERITLSAEVRDRIKERFKGFIHRYIRGISDENYLKRVPIESIIWHYTVITSSFLKIIMDNGVGNILEPEFIHKEYINLHNCLLEMLPNRLITDELKNKFRVEILPVVLADLLVVYFRLLSFGEVEGAANQREWMEYVIQRIEKDILEFKHELDSEFIRKIKIVSNLFGGLEKQDIEVIANLLDNSFGYINLGELKNKLKNIPGVSEIIVNEGELKDARLLTKVKGEQLNWIILSAFYWLIITKEYAQDVFSKVIITNTDLQAKRKKIIYIFDKNKKCIISMHVYANGNKLYFIARNVDVVMIKENYQIRTTQVLKDDEPYVPAEPLLSMFDE